MKGNICGILLPTENCTLSDPDAVEWIVPDTGILITLKAPTLFVESLFAVVLIHPVNYFQVTKPASGVITESATFRGELSKMPWHPSVASIR